MRLLSQLPTWRKIELVADLNDVARYLAIEGLREKFPRATESEIKRHLADLLLGPELAAEVYGPYHPEADSLRSAA